RQSRGAAGGPDQGARCAGARLGRVQRRLHHPPEAARQAHAARGARAGRGVHAALLACCHARLMQPTLVMEAAMATSSDSSGSSTGSAIWRFFRNPEYERFVAALDAAEIDVM